MLPRQVRKTCIPTTYDTYGIGENQVPEGTQVSVLVTSLQSIQ